MNIDTISFEGIDYKCRILPDYEGNDVKIAGKSLRNALFTHNQEGNQIYRSDEAVRIDESIFFYVEDEELDLTDMRLDRILQRVCPDWF